MSVFGEAPTPTRERPVRWEDQQRWWEEYEQDNGTAFLLRLHLQTCVPLRIMELRASGGPTAEHYERVRGYVCPPNFFWGEDAPACVNPEPADDLRYEREGTDNTLLCHGTEALLFPSDFSREVAAEWRRKLVDALAVLAFAPAGVRLFGLHFESVAHARGEAFHAHPAPP